MKYLKLYKLFENRISDYSKEITDYESIMDLLKNIFLELEDDGLDISIEGRWIRTSDFEELTGFEVEIKRDKPFLLKDVYDSFLTCESYMKENGFYITNTEVKSRFNLQTSLHRRENTYELGYLIMLNKSNPDEYKFLDKELVEFSFKIRKDKE